MNIGDIMWWLAVPYAVGFWNAFALFLANGEHGVTWSDVTWALTRALVWPIFLAVTLWKRYEKKDN